MSASLSPALNSLTKWRGLRGLLPLLGEARLLHARDGHAIPREREIARELRLHAVRELVVLDRLGT